MKKGLSILLLFLYLIPTLGFSVSLHYCGGKIKHFAFVGKGEHKNCCQSKKIMKKGCCKDKQLTIKKNTKEELSAKNFKTTFYPIVPFLLIKKDINPTSCFTSQNAYSLLKNHSPPLDTKHPIYIRNNVFLI